MKKKKNSVGKIIALICGIVVLIAVVAGASIVGIGLLKIMQNNVHISVEIAGHTYGNGEEAIVPQEPETEISEPESEPDETEPEPETESEPETEAPDIEEEPDDNGQDGGIFGGGFGGDSALAEALEEGLPARGEAENPFLAEDFVSHLGTNHENHAREEFTGPYYETICDSIDYDVSYGIERKYYEHVDEEANIAVQISCVQLTGDLPGLDTLNKQIYEQTVDFALMYSYQGSGTGDGQTMIQVDSYITYNDEDSMSIVLDELYQTATGKYMDLYNLNLNLATSSIMKDDFLKVDSTFVKEFRRRSAAQNGEENPGLNKLDDEMLRSYLSNEFTSIVFYTPLGMEIGVNYQVNNTVGWVTVTFMDYEKYLNAV